MKVIRSFDDCLDYVNRLGFGGGKGPGWIPHAQSRLVDQCDKLLRMSGQSSWYHKTFKPFRVKFDRKTRKFTVKPGAGKRR